MANIRARQSVDAVSATINAILSVLNGVTPVNIPTGLSLSLSLNPFKFIMGLLQPIVGYDRIVDFITELLVYGLPVLEESMKIALVESLKDMFSCSVNPTIDERLINTGVVLDLKTIDLLNVMERCPLDTENTQAKVRGSFFYSDVDGFTVPDQLINCSDLNAVIWYVKHRAFDRTVWYGHDTQGNQHETLTLNTMPSKEHGVITMEYSERASTLKDSQGNQMRIQVPHGNCLHVFLGNTKGIPASGQEEPSSDDLNERTKEFRDLTVSVKEALELLDEEEANASTIDERSDIQCEKEVVDNFYQALRDGVSVSEVFPDMLVESDTGMRYFDVGGKRIRMSEYAYTHTRNDLVVENRQIAQQRQSVAEDYVYRSPEQNYYYNKTLFEFNTDYVMSVNFFDVKVIAAQIVNILTGCFDFTLNLSFEERLIRNEVEEMLTRILESEDVTVNDCFFSFSNDEYNLMVDETEKERLGRYTGTEYGYGSKIDFETIYAELDKVSESATKTEQVYYIAAAMNTISRTVTPEIYSEESEWAVNFEFLTSMLRGLTMAMVYSIVSPKIYLLMAINLKVMGRQPNFDLSAFIGNFKSLLISVIRGVTDRIMVEMKVWLMSLVKDLVMRLSDRLMFEQSEYYIRLLMRCIRAFKAYWGGQNWNMADVDYADIYDTASVEVETNTNC